MALEDIRIYEIAVTGRFVVSAPNDDKALKAARDYYQEHINKLNFAITQQDGFEWIEPPPPP